MPSGSDILEAQVGELKASLKLWEKTFAAEHGGRKPGRDDIRKDAFIAAKYREYDRLRRPTSFAKPAGTPRKQREVSGGSERRRRALRERAGNATAATPNRTIKRTAPLDVVPEEQEEVETTPAFIRSALGPTPQRDGQVLGIFDTALGATPSKSLSRPALSDVPTVSESPSKSSLHSAPASSEPTLSATPQSASKRRFLDAFVGTPLKRKREDDGQTPSTAKRQYATPSFLRRNFSLAPIEEESGSSAPPFKKRGLVRSLSSLIQNLRKQEDKRMDDEWDILNDLEAEENDNAPARPAASSKVLVEDSQAPEMPLGPDRGPESEREDESGEEATAMGADGKPRKPWKKKGLKRQTRRVNMRPVIHKPQKAAELEAQSEGENEVVEETQLQDATSRAARGGDDDDEFGLHDGDDASDYDATATSAPGAPNKGKEKAKAPETKGKDTAAEQKTTKKVSAQAHPNFRALKIKNKNSKASGKGRRFARR